MDSRWDGEVVSVECRRCQRDRKSNVRPVGGTAVSMLPIQRIGSVIGSWIAVFLSPLPTPVIPGRQLGHYFGDHTYLHFNRVWYHMDTVWYHTSIFGTSYEDARSWRRTRSSISRRRQRGSARLHVIWYTVVPQWYRSWPLLRDPLA